MAKSRKTWIITVIVVVRLTIIVLTVMYLLPKEQADSQYVARDQSFRYENESVYAVFAPEEGNL